MVICTVKPVAVAVVAPNVGVNAAPSSEVALTDADAALLQRLTLVIVAVELVPGATPVTVTKPVPLIATVPDAVAVPAHV